MAKKEKLKELFKEIQPAVEEVCDHISKRLHEIIVMYKSYEKVGKPEIGRISARALINSFPRDLTRLLQQPEFPKPIHSSDIENYAHEELENIRLRRAYFLHAVSGNLYMLAEESEHVYGPGHFPYFLKELSMRISVNPELMFLDVPIKK